MLKKWAHSLMCEGENTQEFRPPIWAYIIIEPLVSAVCFKILINIKFFFYIYGIQNRNIYA
jgi:hypothetical protein